MGELQRPERLVLQGPPPFKPDGVRVSQKEPFALPGRVDHELLRSAKNLPRLLQGLDCWRAQALALETVKERQRPFVTVSAVQGWLATLQYTEEARYKVVLDAVRAHRGALEFNCTGVLDPDLRAAERHDFDEATPEMVLRRKKLFQAGVEPVQMGQSATNCHAYVVWVHGVKLVASTNVREENMARLPATQHEWLRRGNSVLVLVRASLPRQSLSPAPTRQPLALQPLRGGVATSRGACSSGR